MPINYGINQDGEQLPEPSGYPKVVTVSISSGTTSTAFSLPGKINFAHLSSTPGGVRTAKIQFTPDSGTTWVDTGISISTATGTPVVLDSNTLAAIAGLTGQKNNLRLSLSVSDTMTAKFYSRG